MKRLFQIGLLLAWMAWCDPAHATWALVGTVSTNAACASGASTCTVTLAQSTTAGHLLVAWVNSASVASRTLSSIGSGGTWVFPAGCHEFAASISINCGYVLSATGGVASMLVTLSGVTNSTWDIHVREYSNAGSPAIDGTPTTNTSASCTACAGPNVTITGSNDLIVADSSSANTITTVNSPYGNLTVANGDATADHLNTNSGTGATMNQSAGANNGGTIAFSEAGSSSIPWYKLPTSGPSWAISILVGIMIGASGYGVSKIRTGNMDRNIAGASQPLLGTPVIELWKMADGSYQAIPIKNRQN